MITFLATSFMASAQGKADDIVGTYQTEGGKAKVTISKQGNKYIGTLIWTRRGDILDSKNPDKGEAQKKLTGKVILRDLAFDEDDEYKGGKIYDPESGKTYSCKATRERNGNLKMRGFIGVSLLGRTTEWTRIKQGRYVNSIRYNDEVVRRIVAHFSDKPTLLVYFSDHGQALYENPDKPDYYEHEVSRQGLSIPLLVYMSPSLRKMHPEIYERVVKAKDRKIMNDLFSNSLCGLWGIRLKYYEPEYDYFSDECNNNRVRSVIGYNGKLMTF